MPVEDAVRRALPTATLTAAGELRARQGKTLAPEHFAEAREPKVVAAWLGPSGELVALGSGDDAEYRVVRGFNPRS